MDIRAVATLPDLEAFHAVEAAANDHDYVGLPADPIDELVPLLTTPETGGDRTELFLACDRATPIGIIKLTFPTIDNLNVVNADIAIHPLQRRHGFGRDLLALALDQVRAAGRTRVFFQVGMRPDRPSPAQVLLEEVGAKPVLDDVRRMLDLTTRPPGIRPDVPAGYRIAQWLDRCPDELVDGTAYLLGRMTIDAPMGTMDYEPEQWDAARYREREAAMIARNRLRVSSAVVHVESGAVAGFTDIGVNRSVREVAYQWDTLVDPGHRGQGLGLVMKLWNHAQLLEAAPEVRFLNTWNAASNTFMIAVNEALGFEPVDTWTEWQLDL